MVSALLDGANAMELSTSPSKFYIFIHSQYQGGTMIVAKTRSETMILAIFLRR